MVRQWNNAMLTAGKERAGMIAVEESFTAWRKDPEYVAEKEFSLAASMIEGAPPSGIILNHLMQWHPQ